MLEKEIRTDKIIEESGSIENHLDRLIQEDGFTSSVDGEEYDD
jgi:hypothetical protein